MISSLISLIFVPFVRGLCSDDQNIAKIMEINQPVTLVMPVENEANAFTSTQVRIR